MLVFIIETLNFLFLKKVFVRLNQRVISTLMCLDLRKKEKHAHSIYLSKEKSKNDLEILMVEKIIKTNPVFILKDIDGVFQVYPSLLSSQV